MGHFEKGHFRSMQNLQIERLSKVFQNITVDQWFPSFLKYAIWWYLTKCFDNLTLWSRGGYKISVSGKTSFMPHP